MKNEISVLDHGYVRLVNHMGDDLSIVRSARVSYAADWRTGEDAGKDERLIKYLIKNRHTSPLESVVFTFEIKCPIFVARQWHRHRTWSYNEISARYSELPEEFYVPELNKITTQSSDNKQMRTDEPHPKAETIRAEIEGVCRVAHHLYKQMLEWKCPRELARTVLPLATYTRFFGTVNLHNLLHFLSLRDHEHAQYEIQVYAKAIKELITPLIPATIAAWGEATPPSPS